MKYNADYFIKKFSKIPARNWKTGDIGEGSKVCCALGHVGVTHGKKGWKHTPESRALVKLFGGNPRNEDGGFEVVWEVNDLGYRGEGKTPKTRIINRLRKLKKEGK